MMDVASWLVLFFIFCIVSGYISDSCNAAAGFSFNLFFYSKYDTLFYTSLHWLIQA